MTCARGTSLGSYRYITIAIILFAKLTQFSYLARRNPAQGTPVDVAQQLCADPWLVLARSKTFSDISAVESGIRT